jgi:hypothetical protein
MIGMHPAPRRTEAKMIHAKPQRRKEESKHFTRSNKGTKTLPSLRATGAFRIGMALRAKKIRSPSFFAALRLCVNPSFSGARA